MTRCRCGANDCILCEASLEGFLTAAQVCQMQGVVSHRTYACGSVLFREGTPGERLHVLREGYVKLMTGSADGHEQVLGLAARNRLLGFETLYEPRYPYTGQAVTHVMTCSIRRADMVRVLEMNPSVSHRMLAYMNEELERARTLIRDLGLKDASGRIASFLLSLITPRDERPVRVSVPLSREEIAQMLGLATETVSRTLSEMARKGLIERHSPTDIVLTEIERIEALAHGRSGESVGA
ncbi:MAG: Crp/Fnr family transcriptional regulator [Gammaproteobacteria bacterium]|nr:Crp/Fnr family transcriptional regulator [Gemmatimonadota bacterium]NIR82444.1 Crp/Fnr family transcriptional regulator [Gammaproteobacteria bacterium]NIU03580.1 Crp/Fnr family transcriptional regulator [Gammaproteobacteria bacterium]NIX84854.1 helix-turn-helix domain-containing protein [Gammaproteobacteria bacterium]